MEAGRALFITKGYAETSTPDICTLAGITRGALYHHFADKRDLFRQVLAREAEAVTADIIAATPAPLKPREALIAGSDAYLTAMTVPGRTRLLLVDGPAVLGHAELLALDESNAAQTLRGGLEAALGRSHGAPIAALAGLLSAAFDRAALEIDGGANAGEVRAAMRWLLTKTLG